jgi:drug/metabolite transporter (DMT)-like permease
VLGAAVLWSLSGAITKSIELDGLTIAFYRGLFAGLVLLPVVPRERRVFCAVMLPLGLVFGAMTGFFLGSMKATTAANAIYLQYSASFWVVPLGLLLLNERPDPRTLKGIALAVVGVAVIAAFGHGGGHEWLGVALGLASGVTYALVVIGMRSLRRLDPVWLSAVNNLLGTVALGLWMTATTGPPVLPSLPEALALAAFGAVQMAIPYALFARGLREVSAAEAGLISLVEPILVPVWVVLVAHERPSVPTMLGGTLMLAGVASRYLPALVKPSPAAPEPASAAPDASSAGG